MVRQSGTNGCRAGILQTNYCHSTESLASKVLNAGKKRSSSPLQAGTEAEQLLKAPRGWGVGPGSQRDRRVGGQLQQPTLATGGVCDAGALLIQVEVVFVDRDAHLDS